MENKKIISVEMARAIADKIKYCDDWNKAIANATKCDAAIEKDYDRWGTHKTDAWKAKSKFKMEKDYVEWNKAIADIAKAKASWNKSCDDIEEIVEQDKLKAVVETA